MTEKILKAIEKIDAEAENDITLKAFAQYIIDNLIKSDASAERILDEKKSLKSCMSKVKSNAKQSAVSGCAVVEDRIVYGWIREYFELNESQTADSAQTESIQDFDIFADL